MATDATLWQRFWRSPWTWLVFALICWQSFFSTHNNVLRWFSLAAAVLDTINFTIKGDAKWGSP